MTLDINDVLSGARTETTNFTAYISPYLALNSGGYYTKHIYMGSQQIVSKLGSSDIFSTNPSDISLTKAGNKDFTAKYSLLTGKIKGRFDSLGVVYNGKQQGVAGMITSTAGKIPTPLQFYFHSDHLGSSSLITDATGGLVQHLEYTPSGEVLVDDRPTQSSWSTPYKFNGKELDEETGLYYYGARYYDPRTSVWISVDPLAEKYPNVSSYVYCLDNPVKYVDPDGKKIVGFYLNQQGNVCYNKNATKDAVTIANAMMRTDAGVATLIDLVNALYPVTLIIQEKKSRNDPNLLGHTDTYTDELRNPYTNKFISKKIKSVKITLFKERLQEMVDAYSGMANGTKEMKDPEESDNLYKQLVPNLEDMFTTVSTHEAKHGSDKNANSSFVSDEKAEKSAKDAEIRSIKQLIKNKNESK